MVPHRFRPDLRPGQDATLTVNGVVGEADVWVNGTEVATKATVQGDYTRYTFDLTKLLRPGANALAMEVYPNDPNSMFTLDDVDWNQIPPDNNTGIQFPVTLHLADTLALSDAHVLQDNAPGVSRLTVRAQVANHSPVPQQGTLQAVITPPAGPAGPGIRVSQPVTIPAGRTETISLTPQRYPQLVVGHPQLCGPTSWAASPCTHCARRSCPPTGRRTPHPRRSASAPSPPGWWAGPRRPRTARGCSP